MSHTCNRLLEYLLLTLLNLCNHFTVLIIFLDGNFKVKVSQSVVEILAVHICASPKQAKGFKKGNKQNTTKESAHFYTCSSKRECRNVHD